MIVFVFQASAVLLLFTVLLFKMTLFIVFEMFEVLLVTFVEGFITLLLEQRYNIVGRRNAEADGNKSIYKQSIQYM